MLKVNRILFPVEFSERCVLASGYVRQLARLFSSDIDMLHVLLPIDRYLGVPDFSSPALASLAANRKENAEKQLAGFLGKEFADLRVTRTLLTGEPAEEIVIRARSGHADLIVMPTHAYGPFRRFLLGSVTAKVLHDAPCPVWTTSHIDTDVEQHPPFKLERVLCAVDFGERSREVVEWGAGLAVSQDARLVLMHAVPKLPLHTTEFNYDPEWTKDESAPARVKLEALAADLPVEAETVLYLGDPAPAVREAATENNADLVVIGHATHGGLMGWLREHVTAIVRESPCPVVCV